ncbi:MAG: hypothetical protein AAFW97_14685 [Pseudomonadota bacterium]
MALMVRLVWPRYTLKDLLHALHILGGFDRLPIDLAQRLTQLAAHFGYLFAQVAHAFGIGHAAASSRGLVRYSRIAGVSDFSSRSANSSSAPRRQLGIFGFSPSFQLLIVEMGNPVARCT